MRVLVLAVSLAALMNIFGAPLRAEDNGPESVAGSRLFRAANCVACHKWTGQGGGGYGGAAANLRQTTLDRDQVAETVRCGHPGGGGMPYFEKDAYINGTCFGVKASELDAKTMPAAAEHFLNPREIDLIAGYVVNHFKGKGDPTFEECKTFFGTDTRLCDDYPHKGSEDAASNGAAQPTSPAPSHHGLKIESAPDSNAKGQDR